MLQSPGLSCSNTLPLSSSYTVSPHLQPGHLISLGLFVLRKPSVHILLPCTAAIWKVDSLFPSPNDAPPCHLAWTGRHLLHLPVPVTCNATHDGMLRSQWLTALKVQSYCFHCTQSNYSSWLLGVFWGNLESSVKAAEVLNEHAALLLKIQPERVSSRPEWNFWRRRSCETWWACHALPCQAAAIWDLKLYSFYSAFLLWPGYYPLTA